MMTQVNIDTLANEQQNIFNKYIQAYTHILAGEQVPQILLNIDGTTGCGKTYLIHAICQELQWMAEENGKPDPVLS